MYNIVYWIQFYNATNQITYMYENSAKSVMWISKLWYVNIIDTTQLWKEQIAASWNTMDAAVCDPKQEVLEMEWDTLWFNLCAEILEQTKLVYFDRNWISGCLGYGGEVLTHYRCETFWGEILYLKWDVDFMEECICQNLSIFTLNS